MTENTPGRRERPVDRMLRALDERDCDPRGNESRWSAHCPAHDDHKRKLWVSLGRDGRVIFKCHHGCEQEAVLDALALSWPDVFPNRDDAADLKSRPPPEFSSALRGSSGKTQTQRSSSAWSRQPQPGTNVGLTPAPEPGPEPGGMFTPNRPDSRGDDQDATTVFHGEAERVFEQLQRRAADGPEPEYVVALAVENLPTQAKSLRALARDVALIMAYRLTDCETKDVPISGSFAARLVGLDPVRDARRGRKMLDTLVAHRVLSPGEPLPPLGKGDGTRTFRPYGMTLEALFAATTDGGVVRDGPAERGLVRKLPPEVGAIEPPTEVIEQNAVDGAVVHEPPSGSVRVITPRDRAGQVRVGRQGFHAGTVPPPVDRKPSGLHMLDPELQHRPDDNPLG